MKRIWIPDEDDHTDLSHGETLRRLLKKVGLATRADFKNRIEFL
jgi:hypothetical protein